jgi:LysM repeat protein
MFSDYGIQLRQPVAYDIVGTTLGIAALGTAFEGTYGWRLRAGERVLNEGYFTAGSMGAMAGVVHEAEVQVDYDGPATFELFGDTGSDDGLPVDLNDVPVIVIGGASGYIPHQVRAGETLTSIARDHGSTVERIALASRLTNPDRILEGQLLRIPV